MAEKEEKVKYSGTVYDCAHCGNRTNGVHCKNCKTKEGRHEVDRENIAIMKENIAKGFTYNHPHWDRLKIKAGIK